MDRFEDKLARVPGMLAACNARRGHPLSPEELRELAQEVLLVVLRRLPAYKPVSPLESWLFGICALELRAHLRARARRGRLEVPLDEDVGDDLSVQDLAKPTAWADAEALLMRIGGNEADVIRLKLFEDLTFREIGMRLDISDNTAKTLFYRGLAHLRRRLSDEVSRERRHG
ncbi:MAG: sigma-70 family RNA polymerase sigma factor [Planctomycetota bacterium]